MACGVGIVKAQPEICSWHLTPSLAGSARRSVPRSLSPNCPRRGAGVNGASRLLAGYRSRRSSGNRSPLRRGGPRSRAGAGIREQCSGSSAGRLSVSCWLRRASSDVVPVCPICPGTGGVPGDAVTLRAENARLRMLLEDKDAQIAALKTQNAGLAERVARLERLISRNSGNSSMPPGTDDLPGRSRRSARPGGAAAAGRASSRARRGVPGLAGAPGRDRGRVPGGQLRVRR